MNGNLLLQPDAIFTNFSRGALNIYEPVTPSTGESVRCFWISSPLLRPLRIVYRGHGNPGRTPPNARICNWTKRYQTATVSLSDASSLLLLLLLVFLLNVGRVEGKTRVAVVIKFFFNNKVGQGGQEKRYANRCRTFSRPFFFSFFFFFLSYARRKIELGFADDPSGGLSRPTPIKRWLRVRDYRWGNNVLRKEADRKIIEGIFRLLFWIFKRSFFFSPRG